MVQPALSLFVIDHFPDSADLHSSPFLFPHSPFKAPDHFSTNPSWVKSQDAIKYHWLISPPMTRGGGFWSTLLFFYYFLHWRDFLNTCHAPFFVPLSVHITLKSTRGCSALFLSLRYCALCLHTHTCATPPRSHTYPVSPFLFWTPA